MALTLAACVTFGGSVSAADVDVKVLPGAACQPRLAGDYDDIATFAEGVRNLDPGTTGDPKAVVVCPIVRDNTSRNGAGVLTVRLVVHGSSTDQPVTCTLSSRNATGTLVAPDAQDKGSAGRAATSTSTGAGIIILDVPLHPKADGYYVVLCELPAGQPGGQVNSYQYFEFSPTVDNN
jgi:hypothetical protein